MGDPNDMTPYLLSLGRYLAKHQWKGGSGTEVTKNVFRELTKQLHLPHPLDSVDVRDFLMDKAVGQVTDKLKEIGPEVGWALKAGSYLTDKMKDFWFSSSLKNAGPNNNLYTPDGECPQYVEFLIYGWKHGKWMYKAKGDAGNNVGDNSPGGKQMRDMGL